MKPLKSTTEQWPKRYSMMAWLLVALLLCYVDRILISLAAIEMQKEFDWSDSDKGLVLSIFFTGYLVMQIFGGLLSNRFGGRNIFLIAVVLWSAFTILTPIAAGISFSILILARFMLGFGEGAAFPAAYNLIHSWMRNDERSLSISLTSAAGSVGTVCTLLFAGKLIEWYGWQFSFYLFGSMGLLWAVFWMLKIPTQPVLPDDYTDRELNEPTKKRRDIPWKLLLTHPAVLTLYLVGASASSMSFTMASWMPSYFVDMHDMSLSEAGFYSVLPWLVVAIATVVAGRYADKLLGAGIPATNVRKRLTLFGFLFSAVCLLALTQTSNSTGALLAICGLFAAHGVLIPGYAPAAAELLPDHGDILFGFILGAGSLVSTGVVYLAGVLLERTGSYDALFLSLAALAAAAAIVFLLFGRASPIYEVDNNLS